VQAVGLGSTLMVACAMLFVYNGMIWTIKRRNISDEKIITITFLQNRRMIAFCEELGLIRRVIQRALFSARNIYYFGRLNVEISPTGTKLMPFFVKIDE
jgi:hypothetical protein